MIIPIKCFTCGEVLADKYGYYLREVRRRKADAHADPAKIHYFSRAGAGGHHAKTPEALVLDDLGLNTCCRQRFLCHVDIL